MRSSSCKTLEEKGDFPYKYNPTSSFTGGGQKNKKAEDRKTLSRDL